MKSRIQHFALLLAVAGAVLFGGVTQLHHEVSRPPLQAAHQIVADPFWPPPPSLLAPQR